MASNYLDKTGLALVWTKVKLLLADKVDKVDGKGLSSNDYTAEEKAKLANIEAGAEVNVQPDWNASTGDSAILNKPTIPQATSTAPLMDGTAAVGTSSDFAHGDHVHPSDTTKVDKVAGKGLSTNDFTDALESKLEGVASGAQVNVVETIKVNNSALTVTDKAVNITVPTNTNQLTNGAGYQTASDVTSAINSAIGDLEGIEFEIVQQLPQNGDKGKIYLIANSSSGTNNSYAEYIWLTSSSSYEKIGTTDVDLSDYYNTTNLVAITSGEIDTVCT